MRQPLTINKTGSPETRVLRLNGELDMATAPGLETAIAEVDGARRVRIDMWDLTFIDSSGLLVLLAAHQRLEELGHTLIIGGMPPMGLRALGILGFDQLLHLDPD